MPGGGKGGARCVKGRGGGRAYRRVGFLVFRINDSFKMSHCFQKMCPRHFLYTAEKKWGGGYFFNRKQFYIIIIVLYSV